MRPRSREGQKRLGCLQGVWLTGIAQQERVAARSIPLLSRRAANIPKSVAAPHNHAFSAAAVSS